MVEITEGENGKRRLKCIFPDGWDAIKYDATSWHLQAMKSQLKAMDVLATDGNHHWWIEIKDCEGFEDDNRPRLSPSDPKEVKQTCDWVIQKNWKSIVKVGRKKLFIVDEMVEKFRHTLVAMAWAEKEEEASLKAYRVICTRKPLSVVLLLTWEGKDFKRLAMRLQDKMKKALSCYAVEAYVINGTAPANMGLEMTVERIQP